MKPSSSAFVFYGLTLASSVGIAAIAPKIGEASLVLTMLTPAVVAIIMFVLIAPEGGIREILTKLGINRAGWKGWPVAIAAPVFIQCAVLTVLYAAQLTDIGLPAASHSALSTGADLAAGFAVGTVFALTEEIGWRGYMLPRLIGIGVIPAMFLVGFLHGLWHLPILLTTDLYHQSGDPLIVVPLFLTTLTLAGVFYGYLRVWTGSVWPVAIAHSAANFAWEATTNATLTKSVVTQEYVGGESGLVMITGLLIVCAILIPRIRKLHPSAGKNARSVTS